MQISSHLVSLSGQLGCGITVWAIFWPIGLSPHPGPPWTNPKWQSVKGDPSCEWNPD